MAKNKKQDVSANNAPMIKNKKAYHNYDLLDKMEAGISLVGTEVKSLRAKLCELDSSYVRVDNGECWLINCKIAQYEKGGYTNHDPIRRRKLLLHKAEIRKIRNKLEQRGFSLVPLRIYFNARGLAKIEIALAKGRKLHDKRAVLKDKQQKLDIKRDLKNYK